VERRLRPDEVADVLRRAAELDADAPEGDLEPEVGDLVGVDEGSVLDAAVEAGFRAESVSTALAELRAGSLSEVPPTGCVADQRPVSGTPASVGRSVGRLLDRERFTVRRRDGDRVTWVRAPRAWSDVLRLRRGPDLSALREVSITIAPVPGRDACLVRAEALTDAEPADAAVAGALGGGIGLAGGASLWAVSADLAFLAASVPVAGVLAVWRWREARREARRRTGEVADALSRLLDALDRP
jgi:hypothetical protein